MCAHIFVFVHVCVCVTITGPASSCVCMCVRVSVCACVHVRVCTRMLLAVLMAAIYAGDYLCLRRMHIRLTAPNKCSIWSHSTGKIAALLHPNNLSHSHSFLNGYCEQACPSDSYSCPLFCSLPHCLSKLALAASSFPGKDRSGISPQVFFCSLDSLCLGSTYARWKNLPFTTCGPG